MNVNTGLGLVLDKRFWIWIIVITVVILVIVYWTEIGLWLQGVRGAARDRRKATITKPQAEVIAQAIEVAIWGTGVVGSWTENEPEVIRQLQQAKVTNDVRLIIEAYGERGPLGTKLSLADTLTEYLSSAERGEINDNYAEKSIDLRF